MPFTTAQLNAIQTTERVSASFSILGNLFIIFTYLASSAFHKPINHLIFYASWGNMGANVGTLISLSGIVAGVNAPLCQCIPADSVWALAMAFNVYLAVFQRYSATQLQQQEWKYLLVCYGIPFIPAIVFVFVRTEARGSVFGSATLWCWITAKWNVLRIAFVIVPIWVVLAITMSIYAVVGRVVYQNHRQSRSISNFNLSSAHDSHCPVNSNTTEIQITSDQARALSFVQPFHAPAIENLASNPAHDYAHPGYNTHSEPAMSSTDRALWAYMKSALLFFAASSITWVAFPPPPTLTSSRRLFFSRSPRP
ncbi:hypothetical protein V502_04740 [Pseudogymnoascus sp. VKM F-4520 (FW-2644)]|nr:hypothetical protein V502_04740 [Pseudogymnoascus sp. VKM F-4520 (FW-2644)]